jgi:carboxypeptidase D
VNEYSWTNISSMLYVEQPVGTGFSQGTPNITSEDDLAAQLVGFLQQFLEVFTEVKGKKFWLTGESVCVSLVGIDRVLTRGHLVRGPVCALCVSAIRHAYMRLKFGPDIANYIYEHPSALALSLQGIWISDRQPSLSVTFVQY